MPCVASAVCTAYSTRGTNECDVFPFAASLLEWSGSRRLQLPYMNEIQRILDAVERHHGPMYLATVVDIAGSSYRRPGAKMLILPGGARVGTISGGCLELDLCRQAAQICKEGPKLITFDTSDDAPDSGRRYNLGCSGIIHVLVEPITQNERCPLRWQQQAFSQRQSHAIGTVYQASTSSIWKPGARLQRQDVLDRGLPKQLVDCYDEVLQTGDATCCHVLSESRGENEWRMLIERVAAPKPIWIFGAGDDAVPLATLAMDLGWDVTLIDDRATTLSRERFPNVHRRLVCGFDQLEGQLSATPNTAAVVMTHDLAKDRCVVRWLFTTAANYVGILGPKSRTGKLLQQLHAAGALPDIDRLDRLRTPVGLDIGASNPTEIAVSICAEIVAHQHRRSGGPLSNRQDSIHQPAAHRLIEVPSQAPV